VSRGTGAEEDETGPLSPVEAREERRAVVPAPRPILGALAGDPRLPIWLGRAVMAGAVGIAVLIWQGWRLGLTAAALIAIADTIYRSRTTSVIPAAVRVTSAQRRTRRRLFLLRPAGYVALHRRAIPGSDSVIDHLVIGPGGVFALDSERWDRRLPVRSVSAGLLYHGPFTQKDRLEHATWEAAQATGLLSKALGEPITVRPAMAIYGPTIPWIVASLGGVDVFAGRRVIKYFRRQSRTSRAGRLDAGRVEDIQVAAALALPPVR
jgi:Nuclease-related domain